MINHDKDLFAKLNDLEIKNLSRFYSEKIESKQIEGEWKILLLLLSFYLLVIAYLLHKKIFFFIWIYFML